MFSEPLQSLASCIRRPADANELEPDAANASLGPSVNGTDVQALPIGARREVARHRANRNQVLGRHIDHGETVVREQSQGRASVLMLMNRTIELAAPPLQEWNVFVETPSPVSAYVRD